MDKLVAVLVTLMMALPSHHLDNENTTERSARMTILSRSMANAVDHAKCEGQYSGTDGCQPIWDGSREELALLLLTKGFWESRFAKHVHENRCRPGECDEEVVYDVHGKLIRRYFKARSVWQLQNTFIVRSEWGYIRGSDYRSTAYAAWGAAKVLSRGHRACRTTLGTITYYGTGQCKSESWNDMALQRANFYEVQRRKLIALQQGS